MTDFLKGKGILEFLRKPPTEKRAFRTDNIVVHKNNRKKY